MNQTDRESNTRQVKTESLLVVTLSTSPKPLFLITEGGGGEREKEVADLGFHVLERLDTNILLFHFLLKLLTN